MVGWMPYRSQRSEMGVCSRRWSRRMAAFSWTGSRFRVFLDMGGPPLEVVAYSSRRFVPFQLKQNNMTVVKRCRGGAVWVGLFIDDFDPVAFPAYLEHIGRTGDDQSRQPDQHHHCAESESGHLHGRCIHGGLSGISYDIT